VKGDSNDIMSNPLYIREATASSIKLARVSTSTSVVGPTQIPKPPQSSSQMALDSAGTAVVYKRGVRRIHLQRLIVTRIRTRRNEVKVDEILVLYDNLLYLLELANRDPSFSNKFGKTLEVLTKDLQSLNLRTGIPSKIMDTLYIKFKNPIYNDFLIPSRNYKQSVRTLQRAYRLKATKHNVSRPNPPPKRWIGVGYRDKGSARNLAEDGSPSWQEVAMSLTVKELT